MTQFRKTSIFISLNIVLEWCGCGGGSTSSSVVATACREAAASSSGTTAAVITGSNVMPVVVGSGAVCGGRFNFPCTNVTICPVGSTTGCQTISDILVDTGSFGLRVFVSALNPTVCKN